MATKSKVKVMTHAPDGGWGWVCAFGGMMCFFVLGGIPMSFSLIFQELRQRYHCTATQASWTYALYALIGMTTGKSFLRDWLNNN